jgi:hypothetical protein
MVERLFRKQHVVGSNPTGGSNLCRDSTIWWCNSLVKNRLWVQFPLVAPFMTKAETQLEIKYIKSQVGGEKLTDEEMTKLRNKRAKDWEAIAKMIEAAPPISELFKR